MQFKGAYKMIEDLQKMNFIPTAAMYNAIMGGYFREVLFLDFDDTSTLTQIFNFYLLCFYFKCNMWQLLSLPILSSNSLFTYILDAA